MGSGIGSLVTFGGVGKGGRGEEVRGCRFFFVGVFRKFGFCVSGFIFGCERVVVRVGETGFFE